MKFLLCIINCLLATSGANANSWSSLLMNELFESYDNHDFQAGPLTHGFYIVQMHLCPHKQQLNVYAWMQLSWQDSRLKWDSEKWGVDKIWVPYKKLSIPDIGLYNGAGQIKFDQPDDISLAKVNSSGEVLWVPAVSFSTLCTVNFDNYPWGQQNCTMKVGSWTKDKSKLDIVPREPNATLDILQTNLIEILSNNVTKVEHKYPCCPVETYQVLEYNLVFKKKADFHQGKLHKPSDP